jgi:glycosyltransferase involved in cell wall biosynthesis
MLTIALVSRPDHVMLNALFLAPGVSGGPETYLRELVPALARRRPGARLTVVTTRSGAAALRRDGWSEWADLRELPCEDGQQMRRMWAEQLLLPHLARRLRPDVLHSVANLAPLRPGVPAAITLHDVTFVVRRTFSWTTTVGMREIMMRAARRADSLITISTAARDEICRVFGLDPAKLAVVPHGAGRPPDVEPVPGAELRKRYRLGTGSVVLCVAAKRPHKNQGLLLRALEHLDETPIVVLAGHAEPYEDELRAEAARLDVEDRVRFLEFVSDAELEGLWRLADCAAFPTLGEGFGLPVIEAMARGVPVACSDLTVLREVGGDVPHYFPPDDPAAAAAAIQAARADSRAGTAGPRRAARFSWDESARLHWEAYERALDHAAHR